MPGNHHLQFEGRPIRVHQFADGQPWFYGSDIALLLGYPDDLKAIHSHCSQGGLRLGPEAQQFRLIDLPNVIRLIVNSPTSQAVRFEAWLRAEGLKPFVCRLATPDEGQVMLGVQPLPLLYWRDQHWLRLTDVAQPLGFKLWVRTGEPAG